MGALIFLYVTFYSFSFQLHIVCYLYEGGNDFNVNSYDYTAYMDIDVRYPRNIYIY